jgi:choline kinase
MPKQTISVGDEMLIERQTRQVRERGHVLSVVGNNKILLSLVENFGYHFFVPLKRRFTVETFYSTREVWKGRTIILLGDVFYTENTMDRIFEIGYPITFFGDAQEVYAVTFDQRSKMKKHLHRTIRDAEFGKCKGTLRNLFSNLTGTEYKEGIRTAVKWWVAVNDLTCDFDLPRDLLKARLRGDLIKKGELI